MRYYIPFGTNTTEKGMNHSYPTELRFKYFHYCSSARMDLALVLDIDFNTLFDKSYKLRGVAC